MTDVTEGETLWAWVERDEAGVGVIYAFIPALGGGGTLVHRRRDIIDKLRPIAQAHGKASGHDVWLREYRMVKEHEKL